MALTTSAAPALMHRCMAAQHGSLHASKAHLGAQIHVSVSPARLPTACQCERSQVRINPSLFGATGLTFHAVQDGTMQSLSPEAAMYPLLPRKARGLISQLLLEIQGKPSDSSAGVLLLPPHPQPALHSTLESSKQESEQQWRG